MKYWLIMFFLTPDGEFIEKDVYSVSTKTECIRVAEKISKRIRAISDYEIEYHCVTDDHYMGRSVDPGISLD